MDSIIVAIMLFLVAPFIAVGVLMSVVVALSCVVTAVMWLGGALNDLLAKVGL